MRLAWTAVVPRSLVEGADPALLARQGSRVLSVLPHPNPALCIVRCFRQDERGEHASAA